MNENIKYNLKTYLYTENKKQIILCIGNLFLLFIVMLSLCYMTIEDTEKANAIVVCKEEECKIHFYQYGTLTEDWINIRIKNKKYNITKYEFGKIEWDQSNTIIQEVFLSLENYNGTNNEIIEIEICKNKERVIKKIIKIIKGR